LKTAAWTNLQIVPAFPYNLRFPGQYYQAETGLNQNWNRDYDPLTDRYTESDLIGLGGASYSTYAYAKGTPIGAIDPDGLKPGDSFPSAEAAAIDALQYVNPRSRCLNREFAGWIYKEWSLFGTSYTYDEPTELGVAGGNLPSQPWFHGVYAVFHTHGGYDPRYDSENYSDTDKNTSDALNLPSYLATPDMLIKRYTPLPHLRRQGRVDTIGRTGECKCTN
jgi:RHS repeat-associated protein